MHRDFSLEPLVQLGLTALEGEAYAYLLENSPATGYRVAKAIGKPTANTYKAIQSLQEKGAVIVEDGTSRLCRAVPMEEFLKGLERRFLEAKEEANRELAKLKPAPDDERFYYLQTPGQVFERLRLMLKTCEHIALLDLFPFCLDQIRHDIEAAASRGIHVAVKVYRPCRVKGAEAVLAGGGEETISRWPGQWANCVVDGKEHLLAFLSSDGRRVLQAVWSTNTYTSWIYHSGLMFELLHGVLSEGLVKAKGRAALPRKYRKLKAMKGREAPGYNMLLERFGNKEDRV
jgi:sugar-specific transcriptional regulator TrmB